MENVYDPVKIKNAYDRLPHGKAKTEAIRSAIKKSDDNSDLPFMIYFREELCHESAFHGDCMDMMIIFPEILAIIDKHPDIPSTCFDTNFDDAGDHIIWIYKWIIHDCKDFYQIPMEDCMNFFEDYKRRSLKYGYNLRPYYRAMYNFYKISGEMEKSEKAFHMFKKLPRDLNCDCRACERNSEINYYLNKDNLDKALKLSEDIENFKLTCNNDKKAWLAMKEDYMDYYIRHNNFEKAAEISKLIVRNSDAENECNNWDDILYCYAYINLAKALRIYKDHWKEWHEDRNPRDQYNEAKNICCFWKIYGLNRKRKTVKLGLDKSFPLYNEDDTYKINDLFDYYYNKAKTAALKFDKRNGTDHFINDFEDTLEKASETVQQGE